MLNKLINITYQLLDLGKRNRLLNYKDTGLKTLAILNKNVEELFRNLKGAKDSTILNLDPIMSEYQRENKVAEVDEALVYEVARRYLAPKELLCFKQGYTLEKALKSLLKDFRTSIVEKGINSLYASFGFIHYMDEGEMFTAPLLLIPIELNLDEDLVYSIRQYEDEILLNPTLRYYFNNLYNVMLPAYEDEALSSYFNTVREILPEGVELEEKMAIGIYSFYKMNMYNDLMSHKEEVIKNKNIRILLGEDIKEPENNEDMPVYPVVNCDSSQLGAIKLAANGKSFCLQGPPGSGKSQTITNIISTLLGSGKKILFVSEKIAALRVVFENLRRARLSDFAIELHSNKANKKEFIENLYTTATLPKYEVDLKTRFLSAKYQYLLSQLTSYDLELTDPITGLNMNLLDLYSMLISIKCDYFSFNVNAINHNIYDLNYVYDTLEEYLVRADRLGYDYRESPLYGLAEVNEEYILYDMSKDLNASIKHLKMLVELKNRSDDILALDLSNINALYEVLSIIRHLAKMRSFSPLYMLEKSRVRLMDIIDKYISYNKRLSRPAFKLYDKKILEADVKSLYNELKEATTNKGFLNKNLKQAMNKILPYRLDKKCKPEEMLSEMSEILAGYNSLSSISSLADSITKALGKNSLANLKLIVNDMHQLEGLPDMNIDKEGFQALKLMFNELNLADEGINEDINSLKRLASMVFEPKKINIFRMDAEVVLKRVSEIKEQRLNYSYFMKLQHRIQNLKKYDAYEYLNAYLDSKLDISNLANSYKKEFLRERIDYYIDKSSLLKDFNSEELDEAISSFRDLDEKILNINRDFIISTLSQKRPTEAVLEGSEFKILTHEHEKLRRQMPIRSLLEKTFELILDIKPVFLMSPLSVSTYLASKLNMFDCVIFDEASQIFASDALGSIYRAKQCIVIGDTKQMPPSNFFHAGISDAEEDIEYDLESILDKASERLYMTSLRWHYRSRSEELIRFSNEAFYDDNLITVPQAREHARGFGIDYYYIENGRYNMQTRTNPIEAMAICDMVFEHFKEKGESESLGVVAFSNVQAELISSLVEKRLATHPEYQKFFDPELDEPFFVKNLETVQGDERDRIIFSICYGYNDEGKFYQRFGPLNNQGGERRLNVAVTRAKVNVSVVASIKYTDIKEKTEAKGVKLLRAYLEFAEKTLANKYYDDECNAIISDIKAYVESLGYEAYPKYGSSRFRVDLAVKKDDKFILAIMTDLKSEYSSSITDKFRLEKLLLERLGWRYFKIFSTAWINNNSKEKERLKQALEGKDLGERVSLAKGSGSYLKLDDSTDSIDFGFIEYQNINLELGKKTLKSLGVAGLIKEIISLEAPIHREYIYNEVARVMGYEKPNSTIRDLVDKNLPKGALRIGDFFYNNKVIDIDMRVGSDREMNYIPMEELADGIYTVVEKTTGINIDGAFRSVNKFLGFEKLSANGKRKLEEALEFLLANKRIEKKRDSLYIAKRVENL